MHEMHEWVAWTAIDKSGFKHGFEFEPIIYKDWWFRPAKNGIELGRWCMISSDPCINNTWKNTKVQIKRAQPVEILKKSRKWDEY